MNKKVMIAIVIIIIAVIVGLFFMMNNRSNLSVGFNSNIVNEDDKQGSTSLDSSKVLVVYFSESGNTQKLAKLISDEVGGDFRRIEPVTPYPTEYQELADYAKQEQDEDARPEYKDLNVNMDDYDTIFVGYPIWWYTMPQMMFTFFDNYDFSGKTIIPFNTHHGSGNGGTYSTIKELEPNATVLDGLAIRGEDMDQDQTTQVNNWLNEIGIN